MLSRREFHGMVLAGIPASLLATPAAAQSGVRLGAMSYSFRDVAYLAGRPLEDGILDKCKEAGVDVIELMCNHVEPVTEFMATVLSDPASANNGLRRGVFPRSAEGQRARDDLRQWRLTTPMSYFTAIRQKFNVAGIQIHAYTANGLDTDFTSDEIDRMFEQAKALGATVLSSSATLAVAQKLVPFADKHAYSVAFHNGANTTNPEQLGTPATMRRVLDMSPRFRLVFDVAHYVQANFDPLPMLDEVHDRIAHLHIADGRKNNQPEVPFGTGDTPLGPIVMRMKEGRYAFPAMVELVPHTGRFQFAGRDE